MSVIHGTHSYATAPCAHCGKQIVWATTSEGKRIPLDPVPAVYGAKVSDTGAIICARVNGTGAENKFPCWVGHWTVCKQAQAAKARGEKI